MGKFGAMFGQYRTMDDLPRVIPVFPLTGAMLLPRARMPLNIFEPRYLAMVDDAMRGDRLIGMIQPRSAGTKPDLHEIGCAGRITSWSETGDGRFLITLTGVCRFKVADELVALTLYRKVLPDWSAFAHDLEPDESRLEDERERLVTGLRTYLARRKLEADWDSISRAPAETLVHSLAMICPFAPEEKQAILEAATLGERARALIAVIELALADDRAGQVPVQ